MRMWHIYIFSFFSSLNSCRFLRELDRKMNLSEYPKLFYPDTYVIEGGYKKFFEDFQVYSRDILYSDMQGTNNSDDYK